MWAVGTGGYERHITCPECLGEKTLTVIQKNGESFEVECACCRRGYEGSLGVIKQYVQDYRPERFVCNRVTGFSRGLVQYSEAPLDATCYSYKNSDNLFRDKTECQAKCEELNAEDERRREEQFYHHRIGSRRDLAWSVHYWNGKIRKCREELARYEKRLVECKERRAAKGPVAADKKAEEIT